ncbi:histone-lysine N-methyltransferase SETMAR-like [Frieseomelitta varia]|uniref:histone-lysine N-methyltransferase SETMAR-like n=1 Tax=Frieseomelitta varia TaxID=561572 RepID=UPI001CB67E0D|nr:histone-lysine N-methyltransferase SETMAR-like [Frieseomelitta varia]
MFRTGDFHLEDEERSGRTSTTVKEIIKAMRNKNDPFLERLVTGNETWILYENITRKRSWSRDKKPLRVAKSGLHPKKVLMSICWDWKGVIHYELLPQGETINSTKYCAQLDKLKEKIATKRPELTNRRGVVFQHDNALDSMCI